MEANELCKDGKDIGQCHKRSFFFVTSFRDLTLEMYWSAINMDILRSHSDHFKYLTS